jgi:ribosome-associated toxin RatA of RatAB toxin-antitoxin module
MRLVPVTMFVGLSFAACGERDIDWSAPENVVHREQHTEQAGGALIEYWSLLDLPCEPVFQALVDVENYPAFVPGVDRVSLLEQTPRSKTVQIAQRVIGRQSSAKVEWTFDPERKRIDFRTLQSDLTYNDGNYQLKDSPDKKRCAVHSSFLVKEGRGLSLAALTQATRETFMAAARGVRKRAGELSSQPKARVEGARVDIASTPTVRRAPCSILARSAA